MPRLNDLRAVDCSQWCVLRLFGGDCRWLATQQRVQYSQCSPSALRGTCLRAFARRKGESATDKDNVTRQTIGRGTPGQAAHGAEWHGTSIIEVGV